MEWQSYPQPGDANPHVRVGIVSAKGGKTAWIGIPIKDGDYIPRFGWVDRKTVWIETLSRDHKRRALFFAGADNGDARKVLEIGDEKFVDEDYDVTVGDGAIVLTSWSDGHTHLYLYSYNEAKPLAADAKLEGQLTHGDFEVSGVYRVEHRAQGCYLRIERGQSAGAADLGGRLQRRTQAVERRRRVSRRQLSRRTAMRLPTSTPGARPLRWSGSAM